MGPVLLERDGSYTLLVEGRIDSATESVPFEFEVSKLLDKQAALTLGETYSATLDHPQQGADLRFTPTEATLLYVDLLTNCCKLQWSLTGPRGVVASRTFTYADGVSIGATNPVVAVPPGEYVLRFVNNSTATRDFALRVMDLADAPAITPGLPVTGTLSPGSETEADRFDAEAGDRYYLARSEEHKSELQSLMRI